MTIWCIMMKHKIWSNSVLRRPLRVTFIASSTCNTFCVHIYAKCFGVIRRWLLRPVGLVFWNVKTDINMNWRLSGDHFFFLPSYLNTDYISLHGWYCYAIYLYRKRNYDTQILKMTWKINFHDINMKITKRGIGSQVNELVQSGNEWRNNRSKNLILIHSIILFVNFLFP